MKNEMDLLLISKMKWFDREALLVCDGKCEKAWGVMCRPEANDDVDHILFLSDQELGEAPKDPGSREGGHGKPKDYDDEDRHNKWCARECERSVILDGENQSIELKDWSKRVEFK